MLKFDLDTNTMTIVAKDTGSFVFSLDNYKLDEGDKVYFTVNEQVEQKNPKIQKVVSSFTDGKAIFELSTSDTNIPVGPYLYDIEVNTADGRVDTVVGPCKFKVVGGVKF